MASLLVALGALALVVPQAQAIWQPAVGTTWQIVLSEKINDSDLSENVQAFDFDLFDNPASTVQSVHSKGSTAICYFSAGSYEKWRPDAGNFTSADLGKPLDGWPGERWVNTNSENVRNIMKSRMDLAVSKGCDAIDPDNVDCYDNGGGGFGLTKADAVNYVQFLASEGHKRGLAVGLKNAGAIIPKVLSDVEFAVNEQCLQYHECSTTQPFISAGKPVFHIEYVKGTPSNTKIQKVCSNNSDQGFSTLIKHLNLDHWYVACPASESSKKNTGTSGGRSSAGAHASASQDGAATRLVGGSTLLALLVSFAVVDMV